MTKIAGSASGSISQRLGSADPDPDPDPHQNVMDPQHCFFGLFLDVYFNIPYRTGLESLLLLLLNHMLSDITNSHGLKQFYDFFYNETIRKNKLGWIEVTCCRPAG
jgi:hypothetical protein